MTKTFFRINEDRVSLIASDAVECRIDPEDLERVSRHNWYATTNRNSKHGKRQYVSTRIDHKTIYLHRFIMDAPPGVEVDHRDRNTLDNRKSNLRLVTHQQNDMNRDGAYATSKTGVRGVSAHRTNRGTFMYVFRCHGTTCKDTTYFPYTDYGLQQAEAYATAHYEDQDPPAWTRARPPVKQPNRKPTKLSDDDVRAIRQAYDAGEKNRVIAARFGISGGLASMVGTRKKRGEVPDSA